MWLVWHTHFGPPFKRIAPPHLHDSSLWTVRGLDAAPRLMTSTEPRLPMKLDSSVAAVVTGGASGLGEATARALAAQGVKVAIFDMQAKPGRGGRQGDRRRLLQGQRHLRGEESTPASPRPAPPTARSASWSTAPAPATRIKTASRDKPTGETKHFPLDAFNLIIQINLVGTFRCIAKSAAGMLTLEPLHDGERGAIVNTASVAAEDGQIGQAAYSASKGGVVGMTLPIARDLMGEGIRVNTILPGIFDTPLMQGAPDAGEGRRWPPRCRSPSAWATRRNTRRWPDDDHQRLFQRRGRPPRRRHPHGAALKPTSRKENGRSIHRRRRAHRRRPPRRPPFGLAPRRPGSAGHRRTGRAQRHSIPPLVEDVIMGCVSQVGEQATNVARNAVLASRLPESVPGTSLDRQCGSSQQALHFAAQAVMSGTHGRR